MSNLKSLANQTFIYGLGSVIPRILNYIVLTPFYTRIFTSQGDYGTHSYLYAFSAFVIILLTYGMETTYFRFASQDSDFKNTFTTSFIFLFINSFLFSCFIFLFRNNISYYLDTKPDYVLIFTGIIVTDVISTIPFANLRIHNRASTFAFLKIFNIIVNIGFNILFLYILPKLNCFELNVLKFYDKSNLLKYTFYSNLFANLFTLIFLIKDIKNNWGAFSFNLFIKMIPYSSPIMVSGLLGMINEVADKIFLKFFLPKNVDSFKEIGIYTANYKIAALITIFNSMFRYAFEPFIFKISKEIDNKEKYSRVTLYYLYIALIVSLIILLFLDIFKYFIGSNYHIGLKIVPIILIANVFFGLYYTMSVWYKILDKTIYAVRFSLIGAIVTVISNIILIPSKGYMGAAFATLICYFLMFILTTYYNQRIYPIPYDFKNMFLGFFVFMLILALNHFLDIENIFLKFSIKLLLLASFIVLVFYKIKIKVKL